LNLLFHLQPQDRPATMAGPKNKRQKREEYKIAKHEKPGEEPKKKFYRQRAHANPFSDHRLT
jgi:tRNA (guanine-N7-)-methyltransferase